MKRGSRRHLAIPLAALGLSLCACQEASPEIPDLAYHRGRNALALGRYDWARHYFQEDLEAHPDRLESLRGLGVGWISGNEGSLTHSIEAFNAYLERAPDDPEIRLHLARSWRHLGQRERALGTLESLPESAETSELRARILEVSDPDAAERHARAALAMQPDAYNSLLVVARLAHHRGNGAQALEHAEAAARADPLQPEAFYLLARIRRDRGDEADARRDLETYQALRRLPGRGRSSKLSPFEELQALRALGPRLNLSATPLRQRLARLMLATGDPGAAAVIEELLGEPDSDAIALLELAREAHARARFKLARDLYRRALEVDPEMKAARAQLARLEHEAGDRETARRLLTEGIGADPYHAPYHFVTGLLELAQKREAQAIEAFETALELAPWLASYRLALADVYLAAGRREALRHLLERAPADDPALSAYRRRHLR
ncbi:MAG: tetratricopeptide repeat protein [Acidobacteriota bacterium]